jgi:hypothetical protein
MFFLIFLIKSSYRLFVWVVGNKIARFYSFAKYCKTYYFSAFSDKL